MLSPTIHITFSYRWNTGMPSSIAPPHFFRCMADDTRTKIVLLVSQEEELCVCELICALDESQPKISRHLAVLRSGGLLADRRQGQWVYYRIHPDLPAWAKDVITATHSGNKKWLKECLGRLTEMGDRPVRVASCC